MSPSFVPTVRSREDRAERPLRQACLNNKQLVTGSPGSGDPGESNTLVTSPPRELTIGLTNKS